MHVASTEQVTHLEIHNKRGRLAHEAIGVLSKRRGWVVHDGRRPYDQYPRAEHVPCNVHHMSEMLVIQKNDPPVNDN